MIPEWAEESKFYGAPIPPWVKVDLPARIEPFVRKLYVEGVAGIDRYHAYSSLPYCEETAKYLYEQYTPVTVDYKKGTLPAYEKLVQKYVSGLKSDREKARRGKGPTLLECVTCRHHGHFEGDSGTYRTKEMVEECKKRCPIKRLGKFLEEEGFATKEELEDIDKDVEKEIAEAIDFADNSPWPKPEDALKDIFVTPYY